MANWLTGFGSKLGFIFGTEPPAAHLGAFGKHPGWNDHLDDLGLDSQPLIATKQYLYVQGIGGVIDAGQWESMPEGEALTGFDHTFVWRDSNNILVGRLWSSSDGKGRAKYPMVVCAHFANRTDPGIPDVLPVLNQLEQACRATDSADDVRRFTSEARAVATLLLGSPAIAPQERATYADGIGIDPASEAAARISYSAENQFKTLSGTAIAKAGINLELETLKTQTQHIRVPAEPTRPLVAQQFWQAFFADTIPAGAPQLHIMPSGSPWLDVIVGLPTARHLFCLRAGERALPLASEIPFTLTDEFRSQATKSWRTFLAGS